MRRILVNLEEDQMKRNRVQLRSFGGGGGDEDEEETEDCSRRNSLRKRKRVSYVPNEEDEEEEDEEEEDEEDNEKLGSSNHKDEQLLAVTCGTKSGTLDTVKLCRGEECIKCGARWFTPPEFEEFGGRGSSKKWKTSILFKTSPLQILFDYGILTTKGYKRRTTKQTSNVSSDSESQSPSEESAEEAEEDDVKDGDWHPGSEELVQNEEEEERAGAENGGEVADSGDDKSEEEEDEQEMEEHRISGAPETEIELNIPRPLTTGIEKEVKVIVERLPETKSDQQSNCNKDPVEESWCKPVEEALSEQNGWKMNDSSTTANQHAAQMIDVASNDGGKFEQSNEGKDGQKEIQTETGCHPATTASSPDFLTQDAGPVSNHTANRSDLQEIQAADRTYSSAVVEGPSSHFSVSTNLDPEDLDQLKKEKVKMQLEVLKLQAEYYTLKINKLKKITGDEY